MLAARSQVLLSVGMERLEGTLVAEDSVPVLVLAASSEGELKVFQTFGSEIGRELLVRMLRDAITLVEAGELKYVRGGI